MLSCNFSIMSEGINERIYLAPEPLFKDIFRFVNLTLK
jgi:hypothetical protein